MWYRLLGQIFGKEKISKAWRGHKWVPRNSEKVAMPWEKEYLKMEEGQEKDVKIDVKICHLSLCKGRKEEVKMILRFWEGVMVRVLQS